MALRLLTAILIVAFTPATFADDRATYLLHCGGCHLPDGRGTPPEVPTLRDELGRIIQVEGGREYLVRVPGASQAPATDEELTAIINWILTEFNAGTLAADFVALTVEEVARARTDILADPLRYRAELWRQYEHSLKTSPKE